MPKRRKVTHSKLLEQVVELPRDSKVGIEFRRLAAKFKAEHEAWKRTPEVVAFQAQIAKFKAECEAWKQTPEVQAQMKKLAEAVKIPAASPETLRGFDAIQETFRRGLESPVLQEAVARAAEVLADPRLQDLIAVLRPNPRRSEEDRIAAARRMAKRFGKGVIHKTRWPSIKPELQLRADDHGTTMKRELEQLVISALFEAAEVARPLNLNMDAAYLRINAKLNHLLTIDILGPGWRRKLGKEVELAADGPVKDEFNIIGQVETLLWLGRARAVAKLTPREKAVFDRTSAGMVIEAIAADLDINSAAVRVHLYNARQKLKKIS